MRRKCFACCVAVITLLSGTARAQWRYNVTDLGPGTAVDLNNEGVATLNSGASAYETDGTHTTYLSLALPPGYFTFSVAARNEKGQYAGSIGGSLSDPFGKVVVWTGGASQLPTILGPPDVVGTPKKMNALGHVALNLNGNTAQFWSPATGLVTLPNLGTASIVAGISDDDVVVGWSPTQDGPVHPVIWQNGQVHQLDTGGWTAGAVMTVSSDGWMAGPLFNPSDSYSRVLALWSPTGELKTFDFPAPASSAVVYGINSQHQVTGFARTVTDNLQFLFDKGSFYDIASLLNTATPDTPTSVSLPAVAPNDAGQILANGSVQKGGTTYDRSFLLTPVPAMIEALSIAGGLRSASSNDIAAMTKSGTGSISLTDAVRLARKATGLE